MALTMPSFFPLYCMAYSVTIAGVKRTGTIIANMPIPQRQLFSRPPVIKPLMGTVTRKGLDNSAPKKPRHSSTVKSPFSQSRPDTTVAID